MMGLILKDLYTLKKSIKSVFLVIILYMVITFFQKQTLFFSMFIIILMPTIVMSSFSYDDFSKFNYFAMALPIDKNDIVKSKYILSVLAILSASLLSAVVWFVGKYIGISSGKYFHQFLSCLATSFIYISLIMPIIFKLGVERARLIMLGLFIVFIIVLLNVFSKISFVLNLTNNINLLVICLFIFSLLLIFISYGISCSIFNSKKNKM